MHSSRRVCSEIMWKERKMREKCDIALIVNAREEYAHISVLKKQCEFFVHAEKSFPIQKIGEKDMPVLNMDELLEIESLAEFASVHKVEALTKFVLFLYDQEVTLGSESAHIILLLSQMLLCRAAFKFVCSFLCDDVTEPLQAISTYRFLKLHVLKFGADSIILLNSCKVVVAAGISDLLNPEEDEFKELLSMSDEWVKEITEKVKFPHEVVENLLIVDGSEFSDSLLKLGIEPLSAWWNKDSFKNFKNEKLKYAFATEWVKHDMQNRADVVHILLQELDWSDMGLTEAVLNNPETNIFANKYSRNLDLRKYMKVPPHLRPSTKDRQLEIIQKTAKHSWNRWHARRDVAVSHDGLTATLYQQHQQAYRCVGVRSIRSTLGYSSGCHVFRIRWPKSQRHGYPMIGVAEKAAGMDNWIGSSASSWGWDISSRSAHHDTLTIETYPPYENYQVPEEFCLVLDCQRGVLGFSEVSGSYLGDCFTGLGGKTLYVACSSGDTCLPENVSTVNVKIAYIGSE